jgi:hypothetical protein
MFFVEKALCGLKYRQVYFTRPFGLRSRLKALSNFEALSIAHAQDSEVRRVKHT